jgi:DNA-binding transcriptional MerR regulator
LPDKEQQPGKRYVTVREALDMYDIPERTIRRWIKPTRKAGRIEEPLVKTLKNSRGQVRLDLDDLEREMTLRKMPASPLRQQVRDLQDRVEDLEHELAGLKEQMKEIAEQEHLFQALAHTSTQEHEGEAPALLQQISQMLTRMPRSRMGNTESAPERRGYTPDTIRLVNFAEDHGVKLSEIKNLYYTGQVSLTVHPRPDAQRNKQEWWVSPEQHHQVIDFWREHAIPHKEDEEKCALCRQIHASAAG